MILSTLQEIDGWYKEATQGSVRPKLLSKLAALELCGWLEGEFDNLVMHAQDGRLNNADWVKTNILNKTYGFRYHEHLRPMLTEVVGEVFLIRIENQMELDHPGEMERFKGVLTELWKTRCNLAHSDVNTSVSQMTTFQAPSWFINQHRILAKFILNYSSSMNIALAIIPAP